MASGPSWDLGGGTHMRPIPTPNVMLDPPSVGGLSAHSMGSYPVAGMAQRANHVYHADGRLAPSAAMVPPPPSLFNHSSGPRKGGSLSISDGLVNMPSRGSTGMLGSTPSIFIPGTTITKEDVELMQMRFESELEQSRADTEDAHRELEHCRALLHEMKQELETSRQREDALLETAMNKDTKMVETDHQLQALTGLLDASEKELVERQHEVDELRKKNSTLSAHLRDSQLDCEAESKEASEVRNRFQKLEGEVEQAKKVLAEQKRQTEELVKANGLYKATHEKYVREGQLSAQLAGAVETLKKDAADVERRMQQLHAERTADAKQILRQQKEVINETVPLLLAVKELSKTREAGDACLASPLPTSDQWDACIRNLQQASTAELTDKPSDSARLKSLAQMLDKADASAHPDLDVAALKQEIASMQQEEDESAGGKRNVDVIRDVCRRVQDCVELCAKEVQAACTCHAQQSRRLQSLGSEVVQAKEHHAPIVQQLQRVSEQLAQQQKELGHTRAQLEQEQDRTEELSQTASRYAQSEAESKKKLSRALSEIERMKAFMAKLQITDVPHLHTLLSQATSSGSRQGGTSPSPATGPSRPPSNPPPSGVASSAR